jgi:signal transduction histidine kinase
MPPGAEALMHTRASDRIAEEQAALRRVAVLVARGAAPDEVFTAVTTEAGRLLGADQAAVGRYDADNTVTIVARWSMAGEERPFVRTPLGGRNVASLVAEAGRPVRMDDFSQLSGPGGDVVRELGIRSSVGVPIRVEGGLWGVIIVSNTSDEPLPADAEARLAGFTELAGTAIANAQARVELQAYADEQSALRHVATLVAGGAQPEVVFAVVAAEAGRLLGADLTSVGRYEAGDVMTVLGAWGSSGAAMSFTVGTPVSLGGQNMATLVFATGRPVRFDDYQQATGAAAEVGRSWGYRAGVAAPIRVEGQLWGMLSVVSTRDERLPADTEKRLVGFTELVGTAIANVQARVELRRYAEEQAALRRVATLVAGGAAPEQVWDTVAEEFGRVAAADFTSVSRYYPDDTAAIVGAWTSTGVLRPPPPAGRLRMGGRNMTTLVHQTGQPARIDDYSEASGGFAGVARDWGARAAVGVPIRVGGRLWGTVNVWSAKQGALPAGTEDRLAAFTELVGTAIANAEAQDALAASRVRIVTAADEARRRIERDLHDGAQQRLVTLALRLREAQAAAPPESGDMVKQLDDVTAGLEAALEDLREIARGIHPAVLAEGGLGPALKALARRCPMPVALDVRVPGRLPGPVEIAAYYVVSEALTNTAKYAKATAATVEVTAGAGDLRVRVRDDGRGGAHFGPGSGLLGLKDRVEALGGRLSLDSPPGKGTTLAADIPLWSS